MPDFLSNLQRFSRINNIFGAGMQDYDPYNPIGMPNQPQETRPPIAYGQDRVPYGGYGRTATDENAPDIISQINQLYTPEHEMIDLYKEQIKNMPVREKPGLFRRIVAGMASMENPAVGREIRNRPYDTKMADWSAKTEAIGKGASEERLSNANERQLATTAVTSKRLSDQEEERQRHNLETEKLNQRKVDISEKRARVYEFSATHPDWKRELDDTGKLWFVNPQDPTMKVDTGLDEITDLDKINLQVAGRIKAIGAQGAEQRKTEEVRSGNDLEEIGARGAEARKTKSTPSGTPAATAGPKETETVVTDASGKVVGRKVVRTGPPAGPKVRMVGPDGKEYDIPQDKVNDALKRGMKAKGAK